MRATRTGGSFCRVRLKGLDMLKWIEQFVLSYVHVMSIHAMYAWCIHVHANWMLRLIELEPCVTLDANVLFELKLLVKAYRRGTRDSHYTCISGTISHMA